LDQSRNANAYEQDTKAFAVIGAACLRRTVERFVQSFQARSNQLASAQVRGRKNGTILGKEIQCQSTFPTLDLVPIRANADANICALSVGFHHPNID